MAKEELAPVPSELCKKRGPVAQPCEFSGTGDSGSVRSGNSGDLQNCMNGMRRKKSSGWIAS